ncbi:MAG: Fic family protein [Myxococcota bacterium]|nr:Fic family protein [Myxococcota bacterium]
MDPLAGPLLCDPARKAALETRNGDDQLDFITEMVERGARDGRESHVLTLQSLAVREIYPCSGHYRDATKGVFIQNSRHHVPDAALVQAFVRNAIEWINRETGRSALERASYALWRFNWIHPFAGGNGRTSRALAYLIVCMHEGRMLPGVPSMPSLIYEHRVEYIDVLRAVDESQRTADAQSTEERIVEPDFCPMIDFLRRMLMKQFAAAIDQLGSRAPR